MEKNRKVSVLRIYISSTDKDGHQPLYESLVFKARKQGLAGATAIKGALGFGASSVIHSYKFWEVTEKVPMIVEVIDNDERISAFYESIRSLLEEMPYGCLVIREKVDVWLKKSGKSKK
jgi:PII-like signaling protein